MKDIRPFHAKFVYNKFSHFKVIVFLKGTVFVTVNFVIFNMNHFEIFFV